MGNNEVVQGLNLKNLQDLYLEIWVEAFLTDRKAQNMSAGTITFYIKKLRLFCDYCTTQAITRIDQVDANLIRQYLLYLEGT
jgi:site-specific recombinase XerD